MSAELWTPGGPHVIDRTTIEITARQISLFAELESFLVNQDIIPVCKKCGKPVVGHNGQSDRVLAVACECREWRHVRA